MSEWQPIETAPKDGTAVIVAAPIEWHPKWCIGEAYYYPENLGEGGWWWANTQPGDAHSMSMSQWHADPTHWMPLPKAPEKSS